MAEDCDSVVEQKFVRHGQVAAELGRRPLNMGKVEGRRRATARKSAFVAVKNKLSEREKKVVGPFDFTAKRSHAMRTRLQNKRATEGKLPIVCPRLSHDLDAA
eukprot:1609576-Pleurochrysis_carterae.AAC.1